MAKYVLQCNLAQGCVAADGTTQPNGTYMELISWDGVSPYHPAGMNVVPYTGQTIYVPAAPAPTVLPGWQVWSRFTAQEQIALLSYSSGIYVATAISLASSPALSNQDPVIIADFATLVTNGLLTPARSTQILNFAVSSP